MKFNKKRMLLRFSGLVLSLCAFAEASRAQIASGESTLVKAGDDEVQLSYVDDSTQLPLCYAKISPFCYESYPYVIYIGEELYKKPDKAPTCYSAKGVREIIDELISIRVCE